MYAITSDSIKIIGIIGILQIKKFELSVKPNEHAKAMLSCLVDQDFITEYSKSLTEKSLIGILNRQEISIFSGYLSNMSIKKNGQVYEADFSLVSCSSLLDVEKKQRSFQKISDTYDMLLQQVAKDANDMWINCYEGYHTPIGNPIFQYEETNWEFLKRIASHLGTVIIPQVSYGVPQISFGVRKIDSGIALTLVQYKKGISKKYYELGGNRSGYAKAFFEYWEVTCYQNLNIGDVVNLNGRDLMVVEKQGTLVNAELLFTYRLGYDTLFLQPKILNEKACGAALRGTVTDVIADKIKIQLHIDDIKDKNELFFFDWVPITGNLMFCMPEIGTEVDLILNDYSSSNPVALSCFRNNGSTCNNTKNPLQKIFEFPTRKSLRLNDKEIIAESNDISTTKNIIEIKDGESITLDTQYPFDIATLFKLLMEAGLISIKAPVQIEVKEIDDTGATISINETIDINGKTYTIRAEERIAFSIIDDAPKKIKLNWWKLAFKIALTVLFVAVVATVAVALAPVTLAASTVVGAVVMAALVGGVVSSLVTVSKQYISDAIIVVSRIIYI